MLIIQFVELIRRVASFLQGFCRPKNSGLIKAVIHTHTNTHTYIHIFIHLYIYVCYLLLVYVECNSFLGFCVRSCQMPKWGRHGFIFFFGFHWRAIWYFQFQVDVTVIVLCIQIVKFNSHIIKSGECHFLNLT